VFFEQSVLGGCCAAATSSSSRVASGGSQAFSDISTPSLVQNEIYRQIEANQVRMSAAGRP
jgi:hypothetical protein